jgi:hypothetical protein
MSLRSRPRHVVRVQRYAAAEGSIGQQEYQPAGDPIAVRGNFHPLSSDETVSFGLQDYVAGRFHCQSWPGDQYSRIDFRDADWDQVGDAEQFDIGRGTQHVEVLLRRRNRRG